MELDNFKKKANTYQILRSYKVAVKNIQSKGRQPSAGTLARIAKLKMEIRSFSNGQVDK